MKKRIIVTSLIMASVLPFIGGVESVRADEVTNFIDKTKSDLDQAKEKLRLAQAEKANLENKLQQAKNDALKIAEEKQQDLDKLAKIEENLKANEEILAKEQKIDELQAQGKALDERMKKAEMDLENAQKAYNEAQKAYDAEKANPNKNSDFASSEKVKELRNQYKEAESNHGEIQKKEKTLKEELEEKEKEFYQVYGQKKGLEDFFEEFEKENPDKAKSETYKIFKEKSLQEAHATYKKYENLEKEIEKKNSEINENRKELAKTEEERDNKNNIYKKEELALEYETNYKNKVIRDDQLENLEKAKAQEVQDAYEQLNQCIREKDQAIRDYEDFLASEANKQRELEKSKATAEWLRKTIEDNNDFAKENKDYFQNLANIHEERKKAIIGELNKFSGEKQKLIKRLQYTMNDQLVAAKAEYETKINSLAALKEFREFLKNKKNPEGNSQLLKALDEKVKETKKDLDTKLEEMKKLEKEDEKLRQMRESLGELKEEDIKRAKTQVEKDKKEIEEINSRIKTLEKSDELARVRSIEDQIKALNKKIDRLKSQIESLKKANDTKPSDRKTNKPENKETNKPDKKIQKPASDKRGLEGNFIDFSKLKMEKNDNKIRLKKSYQKLKEAVNRAKKIASLAEDYAKFKKMSTNKRRELLRLIEELKETIRFIENYMEKLALSI